MNHRSTLAGIALAISSVTAAVAQAPPQFDVVSIKRSLNDTPRAGIGTTPNRFTIENLPFAAAVSFAFTGEITGGIQGMPGWASNDHYNIIATTTEKHSREDFSRMIRALLVERAKLATHFLTEERDGYVMVRVDPTRIPAGLTKIDIDCSDPAEIVKARNTPPSDDPNAAIPCVIRNGRISGGDSMDRFAGAFGARIGSYVVNETGLEGYYAYRLDYSLLPPGSSPGPGDPPEFSTAVREQLGLKLVPRKYQAKILVIDRLEPPSED